MLTEGTRIFTIAKSCRELLKTKKYVTIDDVSIILNIDKKIISGRLSELVQKKYLTKFGKGKYLGTDKLKKEFPNGDKETSENVIQPIQKEDLSEVKHLVSVLEKMIDKLGNITDYIAKDKNLKKLIKELSQ